MVESFRVQSRLTLESNSVQVLGAIVKALGLVDAKTAKTEKALNRMARTLGLLRGAQKDINTLASSMDKLATSTKNATDASRSFTRANDASSRSAERNSRAIREQAQAFNEHARASRRANASNALAAQAESSSRALVPYGSRSLVPAGGAESYRGVTAQQLQIGGGGGGGALALAGAAAFGGGRGGGGALPPSGQLAIAGPGGAAGGLAAAAMLGGFGRGGGGRMPPVNPGGGGGGSGGGGSGAGLATLAAVGYLGHETLGLVREAISAAGELQHQQIMLKAAGLDAKGVADATARAWETTRTVRGSRVAGNLDTFAALRGNFSDEEAMKYLPEFSRFSRVLGVATGKDPGRAGEYAAKYLDLRDAFQNPVTGEIDPERGLGELRQMMKVVVATAGRVGPQEYLAFQKRAGIAGKRMDASALFQYMPSLIESMGGDQAGTALAAVSRQIVTGSMPKKFAEEMQAYGIIKPGALRTGRGGAVIINRGGIVGQTDFAHDPFKWIQTVLNPALERRGVTTNDAKMEVIARMFGTETARRFVSEVLASPVAFERNAAAIRRVDPNSDRLINDESWKSNVDGLTAAWNSVLVAFGSAQTPMAIAVMRGITDALNGIAKWATDNPRLAGFILEVMGVMGGLALAVAVFAVGGAAFTAFASLIGPAGFLVLLGTGLAYLWGALEGKNFSEKLDSLTNALQRFWNWLTSFIPSFSSLPGAAAAQAQPGGLNQPISPNSPGMRSFGGRAGNLYPGQPLEAIPQSFSPNPPAAPATMVPIQINMDGRRVGEGVFPYLERGLSSPTQSRARVDFRRALPAAEVT